MLHKKQVYSYIKPQKKDKINIIFRILIFILALIIPVSQSFAKIDNNTLLFYSKNNILYYDPTGNNNNDCVPSSTTEVWSGTKYNLTNEEINMLARAATNENGCNKEAIKTELSLMTNLYESHSGYSSIIDYIKRGGWFAGSTITELNNISKKPSNDAIEAVKEVIIEGNRTIPPEVTEHDCIGTMNGCTSQISNDEGKTWESITNKSWTDSYDRTKFKSGKTYIKTIDGSNYYIFYRFAGGNGSDACGDPFGYYSSNPPEQKTANSNTVNQDEVDGMIWNILLEHGFSSKQAAGILGNAMQESALNPVRVGIYDKSYHGLFMWKYEYGWNRVNEALKAAGMGKYLIGQYPEIDNSKDIEKLIPKDDLKKIIEIQLDAAIKIDDSGWVEEIKKSNSVEEAAEIFLVLFEKAINGNDPIKYYKNDKYYNKLYQETTKRREYALEFYEKFGGASICGRSSDGGDPLAYLQQYIIDTNKTYGFNYKVPESFTLGVALNTPNDDSPTKAGSCWGATFCGQCTAMSGWFVHKMTDYQLGATGHGGQTASKIAFENGLQTSRTPTTFSIFSYSSGKYGHTGVVVAVDDNGGITTVENNSDNYSQSHHLAVRYYFKKGEGIYQQEGSPTRSMLFVDLSAKVHLEHLGEK